MKSVRTHTFNGDKYEIAQYTEIDGICDEEGKTLSILRGSSIKALGSALEEGMHALKIPDKYLHKTNVKIGQSMSKVDDLARFIWRLGYRRLK